MPEDDIALSTMPHDSFGKEMLSDPLTTGPMLRRRLAPEISSALQWDTMKLEPSSYVKHNLLQLHSDLLFSIQCGEDSVFLYLLIEHQSKVDKFMPLRLLGYMHEIWSAHIDKNPGAELPLPLLLPFVLHQGPEGWNVSVQFEDLFRLPKEMGPAMWDYVPKFRHAMLDLTKEDPMNEEDNVRVRIILELMKRARQKPEARKLLEFFAQLAEILLEDPQPVHLIRSMLTYIWTVDDTLDVESVARTIDVNPELKNTVMTIAEQLMAKGEAKGRAEGKVEGRAEGKAEGRAEGKAEGTWIGKLQLLEHLMKLPQSTDEVLSRLEAAEIERRYWKLQAKYDAQFKGTSG